MIDRYLDKGTMYVIDDNGVKGECIVTDEGEGVLEIKNIATLNTNIIIIITSPIFIKIGVITLSRECFAAFILLGKRIVQSDKR